MARSSTKTAPALRLTLGGAPANWHTVVGLPGYFHPEQPTPVGGPGELTLAQARACAADEGCAVELVEVAQTKVAALRELQLAQRLAGARAIAAQADQLDGAEVTQASDELEALGGTPPTDNDEAGAPGEEA